jgi:hypothetical protein
MATDNYDDMDDPIDPMEEDVEEPDDDIGDELAEVSTDNEEGGGEKPAAKNEDLEEAETLSVSSKEALRRQMEEEVARFLAKGGHVSEVPPDPSADPNYKPSEH